MTNTQVRVKLSDKYTEVVIMNKRKLNYRYILMGLGVLFGLLTPIQAVKNESHIINLPASEKLELNQEWIKYTSKKVLKKISSYPFLENKKLTGLMGTLNTEVKFYNTKREGNVSKWFNKECSRLEELYPKTTSDIEFDEDKNLCKIVMYPTKKRKGMIQFLRAKNIKEGKVFIYSFNFFTPQSDESNPPEQWERMKASVIKLMEANI